MERKPTLNIYANRLLDERRTQWRSAGVPRFNPLAQHNWRRGDSCEKDCLINGRQFKRKRHRQRQREELARRTMLGVVPMLCRFARRPRRVIRFRRSLLMLMAVLADDNVNLWGISIISGHRHAMCRPRATLITEQQVGSGTAEAENSPPDGEAPSSGKSDQSTHHDPGFPLKNSTDAGPTRDCGLYSGRFHLLVNMP